jgi:hypothetical protein
MFDVEICEARQAVLIRFRGQLTENDFVGLDKLASDTRDKAAFDCIFDMTAVEKVEFSTDFVVKRGDLPQAYRDRERIYVVPQDDLNCWFASMRPPKEQKAGKNPLSWRRSMRHSACWASRCQSSFHFHLRTSKRRELQGTSRPMLDSCAG